jgi:hypothetical protein
MKRTAVIVGLTALVLAGVAAGASRTDLVQMMGPMMMGNYDKTAEITIKGTVDKIAKPGIDHMRGMGGILLVVKTEKEAYTVHLGPAGFIEKTMTFKEGDVIEITGAKMTMIGETAFIAREVKKGDTLLKLRDENGMPLWPMYMHGWHS